MSVLAALQRGPVTIRYTRHSEAAVYRRLGWIVEPPEPGYRGTGGARGGGEAA